MDWNSRLIGLNGARGVGKTTLLLQKILESGAERDTSLYLSLDSVWLDVKEIYNLAEYHVQHGGTRIVFDEVHYVRDWQRIIKNLYDDFRELKIAYTGSSLLRLKARQGDFSRRQAGYELTGLSFREFLKFEGILNWEPFRCPTFSPGIWALRVRSRKESRYFRFLSVISSRDTIRFALRIPQSTMSESARR